MPGDTTQVPVNLPDQQVIVEALKANQWPTPQLATVCNGSLTIHNNTKKPVLMSAKKAKTIKVTPHNTLRYQHLTSTTLSQCSQGSR